MNPFRSVKLAAQMASWATPNVQGWSKSQHSRVEGERQFTSGNYAEAEDLLLQAAAEAQQRRDPPKRHGRTLLQLATVQWKLQKSDEARQNVEAALRLLQQAGSQPTADLSGCYDLLGALDQERGDSAGALAHFSEALRIEEKVQPHNPETLCDRCCSLAEAHKRLGELGPARSLLERALQISEKKFGPEHPSTAKQVIILGLFFQDIKSCPESLRLMERALAIHTKAFGADSPEVAQDYQLLADACHAGGELERAVDFYQKALYLRERQLGGNSAELAALMVSLAEIYSTWGRFGPAVELLQQAVGKFSSTPDRRLATTLESLSEIYHRGGRYSEAANCLTRARGVWEQRPDEYAAEIQQNSSKVANVMEFLRPDELDSLFPQTAGSGGDFENSPPVTEVERTDFMERVNPGEQFGSLPYGMPGFGMTPQPAPEAFVPQRELTPQQPSPFPFNFVAPEGRPHAGPSGYPGNFAPIHLTLVSPEKPPAPPANAMGFSHAELGDDKIAAKVTVPPARGLLGLEPVGIVSYAAPPQELRILPFRKHGIRLRRGSRAVAAPSGLPADELQELESVKPQDARLRPLSPMPQASFFGAAPQAPVREVSATPVELDEFSEYELQEPELVTARFQHNSISQPIGFRGIEPQIPLGTLSAGRVELDVARRGSRAVTAPAVLPAEELQELESVKPQDATLRPLSPMPQATFFRAALRAPVREVSATPVELDEFSEYELQEPELVTARFQHNSISQPSGFRGTEPQIPMVGLSAGCVELDVALEQQELAENDSAECDFFSVPVFFQEFAILPPAFSLSAPPIALPEALKLQAQPVPPQEPDFALPAPLPLAALSDLGDLSFDFLVLKY